MKHLTNAQMLKPRNRRLRKKLRLGEFQELGFSLSFRYDHAQIDLDTLLDRLIDFVEAHGWEFGGGGSVDGDECAGYLSHHGGTLSDDDRAETRAWLESQPWCREVVVEPLSDAWHQAEA